MYPIKLVLSDALKQELASSEEGSYEDNKGLVERGEEAERSVEHHAYVVATREGKNLEIRCWKEAEEVYYAMCSGTFQRHSRFAWHAANRIAKALKPIVGQHNPKLVEMWNSPWDNPSAGV